MKRDVKEAALTANVSDHAMQVLIPTPFDRAMLIQTALQYTA